MLTLTSESFLNLYCTSNENKSWFNRFGRCMFPQFSLLAQVKKRVEQPKSFFLSNENKSCMRVDKRAFI